VHARVIAFALRCSRSRAIALATIRCLAVVVTADAIGDRFDPLGGDATRYSLATDAVAADDVIVDRGAVPTGAPPTARIPRKPDDLDTDGFSHLGAACLSRYRRSEQ
jgi:hypothetical protein